MLDGIVVVFVVEGELRKRVLDGIVVVFVVEGE